MRNMIVNKTNTLAFRAVHTGLAVISSAFAVGGWIVSNHISKSLKTAPPHGSVLTAGGERDRLVG